MASTPPVQQEFLGAELLQPGQAAAAQQVLVEGRDAQQVPVEEGQQVMAGTNLARVAKPDVLMAELRIAETQAKDIVIGQTVRVDTRIGPNGIVAGKVTLDLRPMDLAEIITLAVNAQRPAAELKGISLELDLQHDGAAVVLADATRLQQVLWNLLSNAIKFTSARGRVATRLRADGAGELEIEVRDTGEGIAAEVLPYIFDRFRQADNSASRRHGGLGLGLAIVKQLVELHGGRISASSEGPGLGASFVVTLPAYRGDVRSPLALGKAPQPAETLDVNQLEGLRVLDVSDPTQPRQVGHYNTFRESDPDRPDGLIDGAIGVRVPDDGYMYVVDTSRGLLIFNER